MITDESATGVESDGWRGVLQSCDFVIDTTRGNYVHFQIGGGPHAIPTGSYTSIQSNWAGLTLEEDFGSGYKVLRSQTGSLPPDDRFKAASWSVSDLNGKKVHLRIYDTHSGQWGHTAVDSIIVPTAGCQTGTMQKLYCLYCL